MCCQWGLRGHDGQSLLRLCLPHLSNSYLPIIQLWCRNGPRIILFFDYSPEIRKVNVTLHLTPIQRAAQDWIFSAGSVFWSRSLMGVGQASPETKGLEAA